MSRTLLYKGQLGIKGSLGAPKPAPMTQDQELLDHLLLLRYGSSTDPDHLTPILNVTSIAKLTKIPVSSVQRLIKQALKALLEERPAEVQSRKKLQRHHIEYLLDKGTLNEWAHLSLKQRAVMFHRQYPELKISSSLLHRAYKDHGVRYKYIQRIKKVIDFNEEHYADLFEKMTTLLNLVKLYEWKIVFLDEAIFTHNTMFKKAWSSPYASIQIFEQSLKVKTHALISAISEDVGLEACAIHPKSIKAEQFIAFLEQLSIHFNRQPFAIFLDNLQVHKTKAVWGVMNRLDITPIFNIPYSPDFNGIESYFSLVKSEYKKILLQQLMKGEEFSVVSLIKQAVAM